MQLPSNKDENSSNTRKNLQTKGSLGMTFKMQIDKNGIATKE